MIMLFDRLPSFQLYRKKRISWHLKELLNNPRNTPKKRWKMSLVRNGG